MHAMLMDVPGAYKDKGVARVESLEELQDVLEKHPANPARTRLSCDLSRPRAGRGASAAS